MYQDDPGNVSQHLVNLINDVVATLKLMRVFTFSPSTCATA